MPAIEAICWDEIPSPLCPDWAKPLAKLFAIWPSPVDHDACFAAAGFDRFADSDEEWDADWRRIIERLLHLFNRLFPTVGFGPDTVLPRRGPTRGLLAWLFGRNSPQNAEPKTLADLIEAAAFDDRMSIPAYMFGETTTVAFQPECGHPLFWIATATGVDLDGAFFARELSDGLPVVRMALRWKHLVCSRKHDGVVYHSP